MAFSGRRIVNKNLKMIETIEECLDEARHYLEYCSDNTGVLCDGRPDEVEGSKEEAESEAIANLVKSQILLTKILKGYGL